VVDRPSPPGTTTWAPDAGGGPPEGDTLLGTGERAALAVLTADCAPLALGSPEGVHAAVHAGWRGLVAGVVDRAVEAMRAVGAGEIVAELGPCIGPCCYEFAPDLAASVSERVGADVGARSTRGRPALDLRAAVRARLAATGVPMDGGAPPCTACAGGYFSHRARADEARQALVVWRAG
jgi:hypothetical protein